MPVRPAVPADLPEIGEVLQHHALSEAGFERDPDLADELALVLFGPSPTVQVTIAETVGPARRFTGLAMWYPTFSSWSRTSGIWLEDLYVDERFRTQGFGRELMSYLRAQTSGRIEWDVTHGNDAAERFYQRLGATPLDGLVRYRWTLA